MAHDVFISYSSKNINTAIAVCNALERNNIKCWIASRDVTPGKEWGEEIVDAISVSKVMVVIFSEAANRSQQVLREVERAVNKNVIIIPFRIENVFPTKSMEYFLYSTHWLDALTPDLEHHIERLVVIVSKLLKEPCKIEDYRREEVKKEEPRKSGPHKKPILAGATITVLILALCSLLFLRPSVFNHSGSVEETKEGQGVIEENNTGDDGKRDTAVVNGQLPPEQNPDLLKSSADDKIGTSINNDTNDKVVIEDELVELKIGDYIQFGRYNGKPIAWQVINIDHNGLWLFANQVLCQKAFSAAESGVVHQLKSGERKADDCKYDDDLIQRYTMEQIREMRGNNNWEKSSLREWLNSSDAKVNYTSQAPIATAVGSNAAYDKEPGFLYNFNKRELQMIKPISHKNILPVLDKDAAEGGTKLLEYAAKKRLRDLVADYQSAYYNNVTDKVFLLSIEEASEFVLDRGWQLQYDYWWFRTPNAGTSFDVLASYRSDSVTHYSAYNERGVRPALVLNTTKILVTGEGTIDKPYVLK